MGAGQIATPIRLRKRVHEILEVRAARDRWARAAGLALAGLIIANVVAVILQSMAPLDAAYHWWFHAFEAFSIAVFTVEYALRVWSSVEEERYGHRGPLLGRLRYVRSPMALIDLVAIAPFYLSFLVPVDLRFLRVFRIFLILKLTRYHGSMLMLGTVLRNEARPIGAALFVLTILLIVVSSLAYLVEGQAQPKAFASIPDAMYWAIVTMTTVGYGDVVPVTPLGKLLGALIGVIGIGMVALPAGLLAAGFSQLLHERRQEFEAAVDRILAHGFISAAEGDQLKTLRDELGLTDHQAAVITRLVAHRHSGVRCPHCGRVIDGHPAPSKKA
jgi:voltage-gated potassium channel